MPAPRVANVVLLFPPPRSWSVLQRDGLIEGHVRLARLQPISPIPVFMREKDAWEMARFQELKEIIDQNLRTFADLVHSGQVGPGWWLDSRVAQFCLAFYIYDRVTELHDAVLQKNELGFYALLGVLRREVRAFLNDDYFSLPTDHIGILYLSNIEAPLRAALRVCGLPDEELPDAIERYKPILQQKVDDLKK